MKTKSDLLTNMFYVAPGVWGRKHIFVNFFIIQDSETNDWVLVDAALKWSEPCILEAVAHLFGKNSRPKAILLTHGHFDHVGALKKLADLWDVPVYAHPMEFPYLTGKSSYPPPDPTVGGGMMAYMAGLYPKTPIDITDRLLPLPIDGSVPFLSGWRYIESPGHAPGQVSFFRETDKVLIAADAFVTTNQESALSVMTQKKHLQGPPKYFTIDWFEAKRSVQVLNELHPTVAATGHGLPMYGSELQRCLADLATNFEYLAVPGQGRYVVQPAIANAHGVVFVPRAPKNTHTALKILGITALIGAGIAFANYRKNRATTHKSAIMA